MSKIPRAQEDNPLPLKRSHWKKRSGDSECSKMRYDLKHVGIKFRLGGEPREMSLLELGWRVGLYTERKSRDNATLRVRDKNLIYGGMFVTRIARSFRLLTNEMRDALSIEPPPHVFKKKSLIAMGVIMELQNRICVWPETRAMEEEEEAEEEAEGEATNEEAGGSAKMGQQEAQANWMYDHTVREFQYLSTRDNLEPHLQIDPFLGREADYPPYGYHRHMPPGYAYRPDPSHDGSS
ncbi:hypothetical protein Tco_1351827 [Tanacetum coccineum]